jgi:hypothetical protein
MHIWIVFRSPHKMRVLKSFRHSEIKLTFPFTPTPSCICFTSQYENVLSHPLVVFRLAPIADLWALYRSVSETSFLSTALLSLLLVSSWLLFNPEDGGNRILWTEGELLPDYMVSQPRP